MAFLPKMKKIQILGGVHTVLVWFKPPPNCGPGRLFIPNRQKTAGFVKKKYFESTHGPVCKGRAIFRCCAHQGADSETLNIILPGKKPHPVAPDRGGTERRADGHMGRDIGLIGIEKAWQRMGLGNSPQEFFLNEGQSVQVPLYFIRSVHGHYMARPNTQNRLRNAPFYPPGGHSPPNAARGAAGTSDALI